MNWIVQLSIIVMVFDFVFLKFIYMIISIVAIKQIPLVIFFVLIFFLFMILIIQNLFRCGVPMQELIMHRLVDPNLVVHKWDSHGLLVPFLKHGLVCNSLTFVILVGNRLGVHMHIWERLAVHKGIMHIMAIHGMRGTITSMLITLFLKLMLIFILEFILELILKLILNNLLNVLFICKMLIRSIGGVV